MYVAFLLYGWFILVEGTFLLVHTQAELVIG